MPLYHSVSFSPHFCLCHRSIFLNVTTEILAGVLNPCSTESQKQSAWGKTVYPVLTSARSIRNVMTSFLKLNFDPDQIDKSPHTCSVSKNTNWWNYFWKHFCQIIAGPESGTTDAPIWFNGTAQELPKDLSLGNSPLRNRSEHQCWSWAPDTLAPQT